MAQLIYPELSFKIIGIAFKSFNNLGYGYQEKYYQKAFALDFDAEKIKYEREIPIKIEYQGQKIGRCFIDFVVEDKIVVELKVGSCFYRRDIKQIMTYLKTSGLNLGILILISPPGIKFKRIINISDNSGKN